MAIECAPRPIRIAQRVYVQDDSRDLALVRTFRISIEHAQIRNAVFSILNGEVGTGGR
jgi:hypothetical protein